MFVSMGLSTIPNGFHQFYLGNHKKGWKYIILYFSSLVLIMFVLQILVPNLPALISDIVQEGWQGPSGIYVSLLLFRRPSSILGHHTNHWDYVVYHWDVFIYDHHGLIYAT